MEQWSKVGNVLPINLNQPAKRWASKLLTLLILLLFINFAHAAEKNLYTIELKNRTVEEMLPNLQAIVGEQGTILGSGQTLFLRSDEKTALELKVVIAELDKAIRQFLITVTQGDDKRVNGYGYNVLKQRDAVRHFSTRKHDNLDSQVRVLEGHEALIQLGQAIPVLNQSYIGVPGGSSFPQSQLYYQDVISGFYATPTMIGEEVQLAIRVRKENPSRLSGGMIDKKALDTVMIIPLNQWTDIGGTLQQNTVTKTKNFNTYSTHSKKDTDYSVFVKVELTK